MLRPDFSSDTQPTRQSLEQNSRERSEANKRGMLDLPFLVLTILLVVIGVIMMFSASYAAAYSETQNSAFYFKRQAIFAFAGIAIMLVAAFFPFQYIKLASIPVLAAAILFLLLVMLSGSDANGAKRWLELGALRFQPSEIAKLAIVLFYARNLTKYPKCLVNFRKGFYSLLGSVGAICVLLYLEPHKSAMIIIVLLAGAMMLMGGMNSKKFFAAIAIVGGLIAIVLFTSGYATDRFTAWLHPEENAANEGYQVLQSLYAIGSGGLMGLGFGKSRQKYLYLPEGHNDYVFAIVCEELGLVGALVVLLLFAMLIIRGYTIAMHAKDRYQALVAGGITTLTAIQVILNVAVVSNLIPATGISLPFFSYGGTALLLQLAEMGIILNVSRTTVNKIV